METTVKEDNVYDYASPVLISLDKIVLHADLAVPENAHGLVIFAHGSGSSRLSPRNRSVAQELNDYGQATLLVDLLTHEEEQKDLQTREMRFDLPMLADRLGGLLEWVSLEADIRHLPCGFFGSSTGGGAALIAAAKHPHRVGAVVSRGGRPDLAGPFLKNVTAPTLLIVGGHDETVLELNRQALKQLNSASQLETVPDATHLFEEPGALGQVARLAGGWFNRHLKPGRK